jgi:hypothetical protein
MSVSHREGVSVEVPKLTFTSIGESNVGIDLARAVRSPAPLVREPGLPASPEDDTAAGRPHHSSRRRSQRRAAGRRVSPRALQAGHATCVSCTRIGVVRVSSTGVGVSDGPNTTLNPVRGR